MTLITNTWRQLVRRRLWPIALLLVAALVAVPMKLAKSPAEAPAVPAATLAKAQQAEALSKPVVELKVPAQTDGNSRRRVLGQSKDPFEPAPLPKKKKAKAAAAATPEPTSAPSDSPGGGSTAPPASGPVTPAVPTVTLPKGSLKVRFGTADTTGDLPVHFINRLEPLPDADAPLLVFEGTRDNGRVAVFSIPGDVSAVGDGSCDPSPQDCATLKLRGGQTEFITLKGAGDNGQDVQYELDLVKIFEKATKVPKATVEAAGAATGTNS
jgi:hypothetical protein